MKLEHGNHTSLREQPSCIRSRPLLPRIVKQNFRTTTACNMANGDVDDQAMNGNEKACFSTMKRIQALLSLILRS
jgi:hypothetical protein